LGLFKTNSRFYIGGIYLFIGHYSVSFAAKRFEPQLPLWLLFLAVQLVDIIWSIFIFTGIEKASVSHEVAGTPLDLYYMPYTHSLLGALLWSAIAFLIIRYVPIIKNRNFSKAFIVSIAVFSHWLLDLIVHTSDLPLWLNTFKVGLGFYENAILSFSLEVVLLIVGFLIYLRSLTGKGKRITGLSILLIVMIGLGINSVWGVAPPNSQTAAGFLLVCYLLLAMIIAWLEKTGNR